MAATLQGTTLQGAQHGKPRPAAGQTSWKIPIQLQSDLAYAAVSTLLREMQGLWLPAMAAVLLAQWSPTVAQVPVPANFSMAALPPILQFVNGTPVSTTDQWQARRAEISWLLQNYMYGTFPDAPTPAILNATVLNSTQTSDQAFEISWLNVTYQTPVYPANTLFELIRPTICTASAPCPASMASSEHRRWLLSHAIRGYVSISFHSGDNSCDSPECAKVDPTRCWADNYPNATFQLIGRRAYYASRVLDYVLTLPYVRPGQVGLTGHSRNGKQTLIAVGLDDRFGAAVDSSSGSAGIGPYRVQGADAQCETPASGWPGPWFLPSLKAYDGREHELPIDSHAIVGMIAPRPLLLAHAMNDGVITTFSVEAAYQDAMTAYSWLNASSNLRIDYRFGDHHGFEDPERYGDWYDYAFNWSHPATCGARCNGLGMGMLKGRGTPRSQPLSDPLPSISPYDISHWPIASNLFHSFNWSAWDTAQGYAPGNRPMPSPGASAAERVAWLLGDGPSTLPIPEPGGSYPPPSDLSYVDLLQNHDGAAGSTGDEIVRINVGFGPAVNGNLYFRKDMLSRQPPSPAGWPAVVWVHAAGDYNKGYIASYATDSLDIAHAIANESFVVLAYEQVGYGLRLAQGRQLYDRWPTWSKLGRMVHDALSAVQVLTSPQLGQPGAFFPSGWPDALTGIPPIDHGRVYTAGYSIGGTVALLAAGLDPKVAGVATVSGWTPFRYDTDASPSGGIRRWWSWHGTSPRLGWFAGQESSIPVDFDDVLSLVSPRPVLAYQAAQDRMNNATAVAGMVAALRANGYTALTAVTPPGINALDTQARQAVIAWLQQQAAGR